MISNSSRKFDNPVENLKQSGFTAAKGVNETAPILSTDNVLHMENLVPDDDGGLILRKPIVCIENVPELKVEQVVVDSEVVYVGYLFDNNCKLIVRKTPDLKFYIAILRNGNPVKLRLCWRSWKDYTQYSTALSPNTDQFYEMPFLDLSRISVANTATSSVCTGSLVDIVSDVFKRESAYYADAYSTDLCYSKLYDIPVNATSFWKARTLIITKSTDIAAYFDISIVTPDINVIQNADILRLDANLDLDNPYAIRDVYNTSAPGIKNIIAYIPTHTVRGHTTSASDSAEVTSGVHTVDTSTLNPTYTNGDTFDPEFFKSYPLPYAFSAPANSENYPQQILINHTFPHGTLPYALCKVRAELGATVWLYLKFFSSETYAIFRVGERAISSPGRRPNADSISVSSAYAHTVSHRFGYLVSCDDTNVALNLKYVVTPQEWAHILKITCTTSAFPAQIPNKYLSVLVGLQEAWVVSSPDDHGGFNPSENNTTLWHHSLTINYPTKRSAQEYSLVDATLDKFTYEVSS